MSRQGPRDQEFTNGAGHVAVNGAVTAVSGTLKAYAMDPATTFTGTAATENYQDATGCKCFWVDTGDAGVGAGESVIVSWSTSASDTATTQAACTAANTAYGTPAGAAMSNVFFVTDKEQERIVVYWDGENTIKTISLLLTGGTAQPILYAVA